MDFKTVKLILEGMRKELTDREAYLKNLKILTNQYRMNVNLSSITKEIHEINKFLKSEELTESEKEEFLIVRSELQLIFDEKQINQKK